MAIILVLLGSHTFAGGSTVKSILANPVVIERVIRGTLAGLALLLVMPLLVRQLRHNPSTGGSALMSLTLYVLIAGTSALYSVAPLVTAGKVFELATGLVIVWTITTSVDAERQVRSSILLVVLLQAALVGAAVLGFFALPEVFTSRDTRPGFLTSSVMGSPYSHSNSLSAAGALVFAYAFASYLTVEDRRKRRLWILIALAGTAGMLLSSGRQGLIIWLASAAVLLWLHRRLLFALLIGPATALIVATNWQLVWSVVTRNQAQVNISSLSGRTDMWSSGIELWAAHPWTGYGFGVGGRFVALERIGADAASSIHSGYLEALLGVGIIGILPLGYATFRVAKWCTQRFRTPTDAPIAILIVPLLLHTFVSLGFGAWLNADFIVFSLMAALADVTIRRHVYARRGAQSRLARPTDLPRANYA